MELVEVVFGSPRPQQDDGNRKEAERMRTRKLDDDGCQVRW